MKQILALIASVLITVSVKGQKISESDPSSINDNVFVKEMGIYPMDYSLTDNKNPNSSKYYNVNKSYAVRFDFGFSQHFYSESTADWLGNHQGTNVNIAFEYKKINLGFRFKPWTTNPKSELIFDNKLLPLRAYVNPFKFDYYISYEKELTKKYSVEPSIGITECIFYVNHEEMLGEHFDFNSTVGLLVGLTVNKYTPVDKYNYIVLFGRVNYGLVDYSYIHPELSGGYFELCLGLSYKFYYRERLALGQY